LNLLVPFLDRPRAVYWTKHARALTSIDLREQYIDLPPQPVITRDNVTIHVDSVVYWQITDPVKAVYEMNDRGRRHRAVDDSPACARSWATWIWTTRCHSAIRSISKLRIILDEATDKWGVKVTRVDVKNINPPEDVRITNGKADDIGTQSTRARDSG